MNAASSLFLISLSAILADPASAGRLSLSKGVKLCEAQLARLDQPLKSFRVDEYESRSNEADFWIVFNARTSGDTLNKVLCRVDRAAKSAAIVSNRPARVTHPAAIGSEVKTQK